MAGIIIETQPVCEPVSLVEAKLFLRVYHDRDDDLISGLIAAAREYCESFTRRSFINKGFCQVLDSFPYFTDSVVSQQAYPIYSYLPRYATTLWNYSQMIKLFYSRLAPNSALTIKYIATDGTQQILTGTLDSSNQAADFWADTVSEPPRIFPRAGGYWPPCLYHGNAVELHFTAGYNDDDKIKTSVDAFKAKSPAPSDADVANYEASLRCADVPNVAKLAIKQFCSHWYEHRESATAEQLKTAPQMVDMLLWNMRVLDFAPTRG